MFLYNIGCINAKVKVCYLFFLSLGYYQFTRKTLSCIMTQWGNTFFQTEVKWHWKYEIKSTFKKTHMNNTNRNQQFLNFDKMWKNTVSNNTGYTILLDLT